MNRPQNYKSFDHILNAKAGSITKSYKFQVEFILKNWLGRGGCSKGYIHNTHG
jgi:hypothetical protein